MSASLLRRSTMVAAALMIASSAPVMASDVPPLKYPVEVLPEGNTTVLALASTKAGGQQLVARGKTGQLMHLYQFPNGTWSSWTELTSFCPSRNNSKRTCFFDSDPAIGVNADGRLEVFARFSENLDLWQMYQLDASDPTKWSTPREPSCVDQDQNTAAWWCLGVKAGSYGEPVDHYWVGQPIFPTSNPTVLNDPKDGRLVVYYRGFEGHLFQVHQKLPGNSTAYSTPVMVAPNVIVE